MQDTSARILLHTGALESKHHPTIGRRKPKFTRQSPPNRFLRLIHASGIRRMPPPWLHIKVHRRTALVASAYLGLVCR